MGIEILKFEDKESNVHHYNLNNVVDMLATKDGYFVDTLAGQMRSRFEITKEEYIRLTGENIQTEETPKES